ncbi:hypothetical protein QR680_006475 [Steinernema hermaphroditum]|uniref:F-box domain-containing protein n=1 Tax=Steinernema hermaphroditum TaxID=289476 RepID=A0AA39HVP8_9BILA|nr:hypothetical protein QR680_006475 [Steinernema hermaphroditum]
MSPRYVVVKTHVSLCVSSIQRNMPHLPNILLPYIFGNIDWKKDWFSIRMVSKHFKRLIDKQFSVEIMATCDDYGSPRLQLTYRNGHHVVLTKRAGYRELTVGNPEWSIFQMKITSISIVYPYNLLAMTLVDLLLRVRKAAGAFSNLKSLKLDWNRDIDMVPIIERIVPRLPRKMNVIDVPVFCNEEQGRRTLTRLINLKPKNLSISMDSTDMDQFEEMMDSTECDISMSLKWILPKETADFDERLRSVNQV